MLVEFKVQNFTSFNSNQTMSMLASSSTKEDFNEENTINVSKFGIDHILKSAAVFGANASGKSNLIKSIQTFKMIVLDSITTAESDNLDLVIPFIIKEDIFDIPSEFEVTFIRKGALYRYGLSIDKGVISEEWLYRNKSARETQLFHRDQQEIKINQRSFSEAKDFIKKEDGKVFVDKTRENVPFISVLSQFNGEISREVVSWFKKLNVVSGIRESGFKDFTIELFDTSPEFKVWALDILSALQIQDIRVIEVESKFPIKGNNSDEDLNEAISKLKSFLVKNKIKEKKIEVVKRVEGTDKEFSIPFSFESEGTRKLIYLLGPLFDVIQNGEVLLIDEFDNKFHTLLCKFIIDLYHKNNTHGSQLLLTCHDTNLLTKELFRRDQVWFVEKSPQHESELYSLLEYKEHYTRKGDSYSKDYLDGKYGAIPLFSSFDELDLVIN